MHAEIGAFLVVTNRAYIALRADEAMNRRGVLQLPLSMLLLRTNLTQQNPLTSFFEQCCVEPRKNAATDSVFCRHVELYEAYRQFMTKHEKMFREQPMFEKSFRDVMLGLLRWTEKNQRAFRYDEIEPIMSASVGLDLSAIWKRWQE